MSSNSKEIVAKGQHCFTVAEGAYDLAKRDAKGAAKLLATLDDDAKHLKRVAEETKENLAMKEQELQKEMSALNVEVQNHQSTITRLDQEKSQAEGKQRVQEQRLSDAESELREAESRLSSAERDLNKAKDKKAAAIAGTVTGTVALTVLTFGLGTAAGASVGAASIAAITAVIIETQKAVDRARSNVRHKKDDIERARRELSNTNSSLYSIKQEISTYQGKISAKRREIDAIHEKISAIKKTITFQLKSIHFWKLFTFASENASERTNRLKMIVSKAAEKENLKIMRSNGTITVANSFLEAWKEVSDNGCIMYT